MMGNGRPAVKRSGLRAEHRLMSRMTRNLRNHAPVKRAEHNGAEHDSERVLHHTTSQQGSGQ